MKKLYIIFFSLKFIAGYVAKMQLALGYTKLGVEKFQYKSAVKCEIIDCRDDASGVMLCFVRIFSRTGILCNID